MSMSTTVVDVRICTRRVLGVDWSIAELKRVFAHKTVAERADRRQ